MEKEHRLFVKNLPLNIHEDRVEELFGKYVTLRKIDLKEKKNIDDKINKFAFINVTATDNQINTCFQELNGERIDGFEISVELAKESFLDRLKRERNEYKLKKAHPIVPANEEFSKPIAFNNINNTRSKPKHKMFCDTDLQLDDSELEKIKKDLKKEVMKYKNPCEEHNSVYIKSEQTDFKKLCDTNKSKNRTVFEKNLNESEFNYTEGRRKLQNKRKFIEGTKFTNHKATINNVDNVDVCEINESEKKRLMSLKQKKSIFKAQEQTIRDALKGVDSNKSNKKIIFDDNIDLQVDNKETEKFENITKSNRLFDSDDNDDDDDDEEKFQWNEDELAAKAELKNKLLKLQTNIGNDKRFVLDERFVDDDDQVDQVKEDNAKDSSDLDERKWQLDILGNILGKSVTTPPTDKNNIIKKKNKMVRYDPTASNHQDFEVTIEKSKEDKPVKKKGKSNITEVQENPPIPISKELFYNVSEKLVESLKQSEGFSLLKSLGRDSSNLDDSKNTVTDTQKSSGEGFKFSFSSKSPFKYDSSDDEDENEVNDMNALTKLNNSSCSTFGKNNDRLFFTHNDIRFDEAKQFFHNPSMQEVEFKRRRQELKVIVRSKIRNNLRKTVPWNKKKVRKMHKVNGNKQ